MYSPLITKVALHLVVVFINSYVLFKKELLFMCVVQYSINKIKSREGRLSKLNYWELATRFIKHFWFSSRLQNEHNRSVHPHPAADNGPAEG